MTAWSKRDVLAYLSQVEGATEELDHFALLDIAVDASDDDVQQAFHRVAGGIHPDRHRSLSAAQRERLTVVYARIAEAYRVLRERGSREAYTRELVKKHQASSAPAASTEKSEISMLSPKAQRLYRRAQSALRRGDRTSAVLNLKMALRLQPTSDLLKDLLARTAAK